MKVKVKIDSTNIPTEKPILNGKKPKSLRPMRSMVALRSVKPKTLVASLTPVKPQDFEANI